MVNHFTSIRPQNFLNNKNFNLVEILNCLKKIKLSECTELSLLINFQKPFENFEFFISLYPT